MSEMYKHIERKKMITIEEGIKDIILFLEFKNCRVNSINLLINHIATMACTEKKNKYINLNEYNENKIFEE
tara:strand:- start:152 stop:364 length:213 start_codon:yes stop_codon:yes gene_type:complete